MYTNYIAHHGVKGMRWGIRKQVELTGGNNRTRSSLSNKLKTGYANAKSKRIESNKLREAQRIERGKALHEGKVTTGKIVAVATLGTLGRMSVAAAGVAALQKTGHQVAAGIFALGSAASIQKNLIKSAQQINSLKAYKKNERGN